MSRPDDQRLIDSLRATIDTDESGQVRQILNIGAGRGEESRALLDMFPRSCLTLVDRDRSAVVYLRADLQEQEGRVRIFHGDAEIIVSNTPVMYDLMLVRHPTIDDDRHKWNAIFQRMWPRLQLGGWLVATFYSLHELHFVEKTVSECPGARRLDGIPSERAVPLSGRDRYIMGYKKQVTGDRD